MTVPKHLYIDQFNFIPDKPKNWLVRIFNEDYKKQMEVSKYIYSYFNGNISEITFRNNQVIELKNIHSSIFTLIHIIISINEQAIYKTDVLDHTHGFYLKADEKSLAINAIQKYFPCIKRIKSI